MKREDAVILSKIYEIELKQNRGVYTGDVVSARVLPAGCCKKQMEEYCENGFLTESVEHGSNVYNVSLKARQHIDAYRDLRRNIEKQKLTAVV